VISKTPITTTISLAAIFLLSFAGAAFAHHSVPVHYDLSTEDSVDGVITRVVWGTKNTMVRRNIDLSQLEVGDRVTVIGVMHRQTPKLMYFRACVFADGSRFELAPTGQDLSNQ